MSKKSRSDIGTLSVRRFNLHIRCRDIWYNVMTYAYDSKKYDLYLVR